MIEYRKATIHDIESLLKVRIDFLREAKNIRNDDDEKLLLTSNREFLSSSLSGGSFVQFIAIRGLVMV